MSLPSTLADIHDRIAAAAQRSGRQAADITLIAVSKTFGADRVREAWAAGERNFGENKVQEGLQKIADTADIPARWHLIGHLQSNKAKKAALAFACIQSVDSVDLLQRLDDAAGARPAASEPLEVLVQVDFAGEATKFGAPPDEAEAHRARRRGSHSCQAGRPDAAAAVERGSGSDAALVRPPPRVSRPADRERRPGAPLRHLSMGMSHDYETAIEEGATIVRVGTAIFGPRRPPQPATNTVTTGTETLG